MKLEHIFFLLISLVLLVVSVALQESYWYITYVSVEANAAGASTCEYKYYFKPGIGEIYGHLLDRGLKPPIVITGMARMSQSEYKKYKNLVADSVEAGE